MHTVNKKVEPWTRWQGNARSPIALIGDRYGKTDPSIAKKGLPSYYGTANIKIFYLLRLIGIPVPPPPITSRQARRFPYGKKALLYFTNSTLRTESGGRASAKARRESLRERLNDGEFWLLIVAGRKAYDKLVGKGRGSFGEAVGKLIPVEMSNGRKTDSDKRWIFTVHHPAQRTSWKKDVDEWRKLRRLIDSRTALKGIREYLRAKEKGCRNAY